jgi:hypothetical protein
MSEQREYRLGDIKSNPFRDMTRYPISRAKVEALKESIGTTGFWDNIVAREMDGKPEIAYGHHRLVAMRELWPASHVVNLNVADLDDERMLKVMARENMEEWAANALVAQETVRAVVLALADGKIRFPPLTEPERRSGVMTAPSFVRKPAGGTRCASDKFYTAGQVGAFLGWHRKKAESAINALSMLEQELLSDSDFDGLNATAADALVRETQKAFKANITEAKVLERAAAGTVKQLPQAAGGKQRAAEQHKTMAITEAKKVGEAVAQAIKSGAVGYKEAGKIAAKVRKPTPTEEAKSKSTASVDRHAERFTDKLLKFQENELDSEVAAGLGKFSEHMTPMVRRNLVKALERLERSAAKIRESVLEVMR